MNRLVLFTMIMMVPSLTFAASFDCGKAHTKVEKMICGDKELSRLDSELGAAYASASCTYPSARDTVVAAQKKWIASVRDKCNDVGCLRRVYSERLDVLIQVRPGKSEARYVVERDRRSAQTAEFQKDLKSHGVAEKLTKCDLMVEMYSPGGGRDVSYGAVCKLNERPVLICNDTMIGKLTIDFEGGDANGDRIVDFMENNCPPGG
jgi:uncharacterized protein